jgi:hypothetical protein
MEGTIKSDVLSISASKETAVMTISAAPVATLEIHNQVRLWPDGRIEYLAGYDPDEAAKIFWQAMSHHMPKQS